MHFFLSLNHYSYLKLEGMISKMSISLLKINKNIWKQFLTRSVFYLSGFSYFLKITFHRTKNLIINTILTYLFKNFIKNLRTMIGLALGLPALIRCPIIINTN